MLRRITSIFLLAASTLTAADLPWSSGQRLVIAGDSITDAQKYSHYLIAYLHLRYPSLHLHLHSYGRGGTSMGAYIQGSGTDYEEYAKIVEPFGANYTSFMFGHNGGLSSDAWQADFETLLAEAEASPTAPLLFGPQPQSNATGKTSLGGTVSQPSADGYSTRLKNLATAGSYPFSDTWNTLWPVFTNAANWTAIQYPGTQGTPQTHPGTVGHVLMAYTIIQQLGWGTNVSSATLAANTNTTTSSSGCTISSVALTSTGGTFNRLDQRLPWAIDEAGRADAVSMIPAMSGWQSYTMTITGLSAGTYTIKCDGVVIGTASNTQLAAGWNMSDLTTGPVWDQCQEVLGRIRDAQGINRVTLANKSPNVGMVRYVSNAKVEYKTNGLRGSALKAALADEIAGIDALDALIWSAAAPVTRTYSIEGATGAAPVVTITTPASAPTEDAGTAINFVATATDTEDGNLASSVVWTSSIDGALGTGASIAPTLSAGFHTITATVTDSASNTSLDTIAATINAPVTSDYTPPRGIPSPIWGTLDPITEYAPPPPAGWPTTAEAGFYYIDNTHPSATDSSNTYGTPNLPRATIPETGFASGARVEIRGGPYQWSTGDAEFDLNAAGTESNPVWIVGDGIIQGRWEITGEYCIVDGLRFQYNVGASKPSSFRFGGDASGDCDHICFRNVTVDGGGYELAGSASSCFDFLGSSGDEVNNIVLYNVTVEDYGDVNYTRTVAYSDDHAFHPGFYCNRIWFLECTVTRPAGDAIQITGNNATGEQRAQYIYVGGCDFSDTGENAVDVKSSLDVVVSGNVFHNFPGGLGGNGTAVVIQQEGGSGCDHIWVLFNDISDCYEGVRTEEVGTNIYVIGNTIRDVYSKSGNSAFSTRTAGTQTSFIDNTVYGLATGVHGVKWDGTGGNAPDLQMSGNLFAGKSDDAAFWYDGDATLVSRGSNRNAFDSSGQFRVTWEGTSYTSLASFQSGKGEEANSAYGNTALLGNLRPGSSSVARGINTEHAAYATFESRYGLNIRFDIAGVPRPTSGAWDSGAYQFVGGTASASGLNVATLNIGAP